MLCKPKETKDYEKRKDGFEFQSVLFRFLPFLSANRRCSHANHDSAAFRAFDMPYILI